MKIEDLIKIPQIKLFDTNIFEGPSKSLPYNFLYNCTFFSEIDSETINHYLSSFSRGMEFLQDGFFSIPEVGKEMGRLLNILNESIKYHKSTEFKQNFSAGEKRRNRLIARFKNSTDTDFEDSQENMEKLSLLSKRVYSLINKIYRRNILDEFNSEETRTYKEFTRYLIELCERDSSILVDTSKKYGEDERKHLDKDKLNTDQKLVAASLTLARRKPVILISGDSDLERMIGELNYDFYGNHPLLPENPVEFYRINREGEVELVTTTCSPEVAVY